MFTARYVLSPYITQVRLVLKGLRSVKYSVTDVVLSCYFLKILMTARETLRGCSSNVCLHF